MLRRTESVVEKLLANWIALCFYDHLAEKPAGCTLYFLFRALKHQIEKGPVDAITSDARYSLSEDRLLKEKIDAEPVLLYVIPPTAADLADRQEKSTCRVLDCDSVGQVKSKILDCVYAKKPYGQRPTVHDVDLEWRSPAGPRMLDDEDRTSPVPGRDGWRRLNTLKHYGISGSAAVALIPKHRPTTMARNGTSKGRRVICGQKRVVWDRSFINMQVHWG